MVAAALCWSGPLQAAEAGQPKPGNVFYVAAGAEPEAVAASPYWLGVEVFTVSPALKAQLGLADKEGLVVEAITPGGPAEKAGVKLYDVLVKAGGKKVEDVSNLVVAMTEAKDGKLALDVIRSAKPLSITVTLEKRPKGWLGRPPAASDPEALAAMIERLRIGGGGPVQMRFFRPGVILPPRAPLLLNVKLPENTSVIITREGDKPATIVVKQGEQQWETTENELGKIPESLRPAVQQMLGRGNVTFAMPGPAMIGQERPEAGLEKRLDDLSRQVDQLRKALEQARGGAPHEAPPAASPPPPPPPGGAAPPPPPEGQQDLPDPDPAI
jgi:hypothetical protein